MLCVGLGMYFVRVWGCLVCRLGDALCVGLGCISRGLGDMY